MSNKKLGYTKISLCITLALYGIAIGVYYYHTTTTKNQITPLMRSQDLLTINLSYLELATQNPPHNAQALAKPTHTKEHKSKNSNTKPRIDSESKQQIAKMDSWQEDAYSLQIKQILAKESKLPQGLRFNKIYGDVTLSFCILESGDLREVQVQQTSGFAKLDELALKTLLKAHKKFPKPESKRVMSVTLVYRP